MQLEDSTQVPLHSLIHQALRDPNSQVPACPLEDRSATRRFFNNFKTRLPSFDLGYEVILDGELHRFPASMYLTCAWKFLNTPLGEIYPMGECGEVKAKQTPAEFSGTICKTAVDHGLDLGVMVALASLGTLGERHLHHYAGPLILPLFKMGYTYEDLTR